MDYFASFSKTIREQASAAASKARHLAENVTEKAQDFAQVAAENAKVLAEKLKEDAKGLSEQSQWQEAAEKAKTTLFELSPFNKTGEKTEEVPEHELEAFGITTEYKDFVRSLDYSTFRDFDEKQLESQVGFVMSEDGTSFRLNAWQERHAVLALKVFGELDHLRYLLCPKRMTEEKFWLVYFSLAQSHLPEGCKTGVLPQLTQGRQETADQEEETPQEKQEAKDEANEDNGSNNDDLDKYLNDVLHDEDEAGVSSNDEDFEDLDGYMEQLNAEMNSSGEQSTGVSDVDELLEGAVEEKAEASSPPPAETRSRPKEDATNA